jgi:23S rRNA (guanosine2251-2'-O)-methyltransferase
MINEIAGLNPILALLRHRPERVRAIVLHQPTPSRRLDEVRQRAADLGIPVREEPPRVVPGERPERITARIAPWDYADWHAWLEKVQGASPAPIVLALDQVTDQGNFGALVRTAEFFGASGVLVPKDRTVTVTDATVRSSQGALLFTDVVQVTNLARALGDLKQRGFWVVGTADQATAGFQAFDPHLPLVLVLGAEGSGLRELTRKCCDFLVGVPSRGVTASLNVGVFAALALWEVQRRRAENA